MTTTFNISLSCNNSIPGFIGNLWRVLLLRNHFNVQAQNATISCLAEFSYAQGRKATMHFSTLRWSSISGGDKNHPNWFLPQKLEIRAGPATGSLSMHTWPAHRPSSSVSCANYRKELTVNDPFSLCDVPVGICGSCIHHVGLDICFNEYNYHDSL